jgi:hypothetical protein
MTQPVDIAARLLRLEQKLLAYQQLHTDELAELWQALNECKREIVVSLPDHSPENQPMDTDGRGLILPRQVGDERLGQSDENSGSLLT